MPKPLSKTAFDSSARNSIWETDLLGRRGEADRLQLYLVERSKALANVGRNKAITLAVDAPYGAGKTDFLTRLFNQTAIDHPAAFIDAWADDTANAPWAALLVGVEAALGPLKDKINPEARKLLTARGGEFLRAVAKGATRQTLSKFIGSEAYDDIANALFDQHSIDKLDAYQERKSAIRNLKQALQEAVSSINGDISWPLFIFIDELDRCRPTYAISFLEELKHLFDVSGIVFVLAIHGSQLENSIAALYGENFDAKDYLRRFVDKRYTLKKSDVESLVSFYVNQNGLDLNLLRCPNVDRANPDAILSFISKSLMFWNVKPRNIIRVIDNLSTFLALWRHKVGIRLELLLPIVIEHTMNVEYLELSRNTSPSELYNWKYIDKGQRTNRNPEQILQRFRFIAGQQPGYLENFDHSDCVDKAIYQIFVNESSNIPSGLHYSQILASYEGLIGELAGLE